LKTRPAANAKMPHPRPGLVPGTGMVAERPSGPREPLQAGAFLPFRESRTVAVPPMPKIDINKVAEILKRNELEPALLRQIVEEMQLVAQPENEEEKPPPVKKQFCILVSDPEGRLPAGVDFTGWVLQIPEEESVSSTTERIHRASYEYNTTKRGRLMPVKTIGEAMEHVAAKHLKEAQVWVKTKEPVFMLRTDNKIPMETSAKDARRHRLE
jgi:hypothetical protein